MLHNNTALADPGNAAPDAPADLTDAVTVDTQFGPMTFNREAAINFANGMLGFGGQTTFALANLPDPAYGNFKLMQSLDGSGLGFLVLPLDALPDHIHPDDVAEALQALAIETDDALVLMVVTVRKTEDKATLSVNLRAPVVIDAKARKGVQYVLANSAYPIRHEL